MTDLEVLATVTRSLRERLYRDFLGARVSDETIARLNEMLTANLADLKAQGRIREEYGMWVYRDPKNPDGLLISFNPPLRYIPITMEPSGG